MTSEATAILSRRADRARAGLLRELESGRFATAERLPGERELAIALGVSRTTLRKAMATLIREGHIEQRQGFGTFVHREGRDGSAATAHHPDTHQSLDTPGSELQDQGAIQSWTEDTIGSFQPNAEETMMLDLCPGQQVWRWSRLGSSQGDRPIVHETISMIKLSDRGQISPHPPDIHHPAIERKLRRVRSGILPDTTIRLLGCMEKTIGIFTEERGFTADGACAVFTRLCRTLAGFDMTVSIQAASAKAPARP